MALGGEEINGKAQYLRSIAGSMERNARTLESLAGAGMDQYLMGAKRGWNGILQQAHMEQGRKLQAQLVTGVQTLRGLAGDVSRAAQRLQAAEYE